MTESLAAVVPLLIRIFPKDTNVTRRSCIPAGFLIAAWLVGLSVPAVAIADE